MHAQFAIAPSLPPPFSFTPLVLFSSLLSVSAARGAAPGAGRFRAAVYEHEMVLSNAQLRAATLSNTGAALRLPRHPLLQGGRSQPHGGQPRGAGDTG